MEHVQDEKPSRREKIFFWLILSALSTFFAEVISGSYIFPFTTVWGWIGVLPLYGLHCLIIGHFVLRGRPKLWLLFIGGVIFGLYEAYITKVLWIPTWGEPMVSMGGVAIVETMVLVLWWHPLLSFILPLFTAEYLLTGSSEIYSELPAKLRRSVARRPILIPALFFLWAGMLHGGSSPSPIHSLASSISVFGFLALLAYLWRKKILGQRYSFRSLMPSKKEMWVLAIPLALIYIIMGIFIRPEILPGITGHVIILSFYIGAFLLFRTGLKRSRRSRSSKKPGPRYTWKNTMLFAGIFTASSVLWSLSGLGVWALMISWFPGIWIGINMLGWSVKKIL